MTHVNLPPKNVLIADDEPLARDRIRRLIDDIPGYRVCGDAADGGSALRQVAELGPDIVLLDIRMPGMDGMDVAAAISELDKMKELGRHANIVSLMNFGSIPNPGIFWMVKQFCEGGTLEDWIKDGRILNKIDKNGVGDSAFVHEDSKQQSELQVSDTEMWRWWGDMAAGLQFLHHRSIVHHDITPQNVFLTSSRVVAATCKLGDFGLSTRTDKHGVCTQMGSTEV